MNVLLEQNLTEDRKRKLNFYDWSNPFAPCAHGLYLGKQGGIEDEAGNLKCALVLALVLINSLNIFGSLLSHLKYE